MADVVLTKRELSILWPRIESMPREQRQHIRMLRRHFPRSNKDYRRVVKSAQRLLAEKRALRDNAMRQLGISWPPWDIYALPMPEPTPGLGRPETRGGGR